MFGGLQVLDQLVPLRRGVRPRPAPRAAARVTTDGKFLRVGDSPFRVRGATYGSFRARKDGALFPEREQAARDFHLMAAAGLTTVRTYALPPDDVLDLAEDAGLRLIVGLSYHDWRMEPQPGRAARRRILAAGRAAVAEAVERCAERSCVLAISVGNEIPADIVRLYGARSVERDLSALVRDVQSGGLLATYTNFPSTEYLQVGGQDIAAFNVFLEDPDDFARYLRHLQVVVGEIPLVLTELGLAAELHGQEAQADALAWQLRAVDEAGCAGATVFSWTDDWVVGGNEVDGWGFGVTDRDRRPKPALDVLRHWTGTSIRDLRSKWPRISVVVCARNEEAHVDDCLSSLMSSPYPELEVIFCDDGSTDNTLALARSYPAHVLALQHGGLSNARNSGLAAATGEIVAYLDADAECHPEWPFHLALSFEDPQVAATGGPNLPPHDAPFIERVVGAAPGGPVHVLVGDDRAEHVPGCNMAFRRHVLEGIGGFDPIFTSAGDDVDVCWKILDHGYEIGFAAAAQVHHHRPETLKRYLRQQRSYGRSERMLQGRHRHRFNRLGQARWAGSIYGGPRVLPGLFRPLVYHGPMGFAPFQTVHARRGEHALATFASLLPLALPLALLGALAPLSLWWLAAPVVALVAMAGYGLAVAAAVEPALGEARPLTFRALVAALHLAQPIVRMWGRLRGRRAPALTPVPSVWTGDRGVWVHDLLDELSFHHCAVRPAGPHESWDIAVTVGPFLRAQLTTAVAWSWTPLLRVGWRPRPAAIIGVCAVATLTPLVPLAGIGVAAAMLLSCVAEWIGLRRIVRGAWHRTTVTHEAP
jgi:glycosyltransferase involved in cell wall biosynthesis